MVKFAFIHGKRRKARLQPCRISPQRGERSLAGGERSEPPDRIGITIRTPAGVAGAPRTPAGARWLRRHGPGVRKKRSPLAKFLPLLQSGWHRSGGLTGLTRYI